MRWVSDPTCWEYLTTMLISAWGLYVFGEWWLRMGRATPVYGYITLILFGTIIHFGSMFAVRRLFFIDRHLQALALQSWWWACKSIPLMAGILCIVSHHTYRRYIVRVKYKPGEELSADEMDHMARHSTTGIKSAILRHCNDCTAKGIILAHTATLDEVFTQLRKKK